MSNVIQMPNRQIAFGLLTAGAPLAPQEDFGPAINTYTPSLLRDRKILGDQGVSPQAFETLVLQVHEKGIAGNVVFIFERSSIATEFIEAWDKTADLCQKHKERAKMTDQQRAEVDAPEAIPEHSAKTIAEVLCVHLNNDAACKELMFVNPPICSTSKTRFIQGRSKGGEQNTSTGVAIGETTGTGQIWSTNLNNETRALMKLHPRIK